MENFSKIGISLLVIMLCAVCTVGLIIRSIYLGINKIPENEVWRITTLGRNSSLTSINDLILIESRNAKEGECLCVFAADKETGEIIWSTEELAQPYIAEHKKRYEPQTPPRAPGIVEIIKTDDEKNIVYVIINYSSLYALNGSNGNVIWGSFHVSEYTFSDSEYSTLLFVVDEMGDLFALDQLSGKEMWKNAGVRNDSNFYTRLFTHGNTLFVGVDDYEDNSKLLTFDIHSGNKLWETDIKPKHFSYVFTKDSLYLIWKGYYEDQMGQILALDLADGKKIWSTFFPDYALDPSPPQVVANQLYVVENKEKTVSKLVARNANNGEVLWEFNKDYSHEEIRYTAYENMVYVGSETGYIFALDSKTGQEIWKVMTEAFPTCMTVINDSLVVESKHSYITVLNNKTGSQKWIQPIPVRSHISDCFESGSTVRVREDKLFVVDDYRNVHALDLNSGQEIWSWRDYRYPTWRIIPTYKPVPEIGTIENNVIYIFNSRTISDGIFALEIQ